MPIFIPKEAKKSGTAKIKLVITTTLNINSEVQFSGTRLRKISVTTIG